MFLWLVLRFVVIVVKCRLSVMKKVINLNFGGIVFGDFFIVVIFREMVFVFLRLLRNFEILIFVLNILKFLD